MNLRLNPAVASLAVLLSLCHIQPAAADTSVSLAGPPGTNLSVLNDPTRVSNSRDLSGVVNGSLSGEANLAAGTLRAFMSVEPTTIVFGNNAGATASFSDQITLLGPAGPAVALSFFMDLDARMTIEGVIASGSATLGLNALMSTTGTASPNSNSTLGITRFRRFLGGSIAADTINCSGSDCNFNTPLTLDGLVDARLVHEIMVLPNQPFTLTANLQLVGSGAPGLLEMIDAGHTGVLSVALPSGYSLSSASGVFLTQPVPLPGAMLLMVSALCAVPSLVRRQEV